MSARTRCLLFSLLDRPSRAPLSLIFLSGAVSWFHRCPSVGDRQLTGDGIRWPPQDGQMDGITAGILCQVGSWKFLHGPTQYSHDSPDTTHSLSSQLSADMSARHDSQPQHSGGAVFASFRSMWNLLPTSTPACCIPMKANRAFVLCMYIQCPLSGSRDLVRGSIWGQLIPEQSVDDSTRSTSDGFMDGGSDSATDEKWLPPVDSSEGTTW